MRWKTRSVVSLVIVAGSVVTLFGRPISVTFASPGKSTALVDLHRQVDLLPLLDADGVELEGRGTGRDVSLANGDETVSLAACDGDRDRAGGGGRGISV